jgi:glyoxylase-like metal-dependent hydrolase (beta-lactamase superfamily II)
MRVGNLTIAVFGTPCHTQGSLCYHVTPDPGAHDHPGAIFTGDTLFVGGVGAFFEGTSKDMLKVLYSVYMSFFLLELHLFFSSFFSSFFFSYAPKLREFAHFNLVSPPSHCKITVP